MNARPFLVGLAVGAIIVAGLVLALRSDRSPSPGLGPGPAIGTGGNEELTQEVARLRAQLERAEAPTERTQQDNGVVEAAADRSEIVVASAPTSTATAIMLNHYRALREQGFIGEWAEADGSELAGFLVGRWMEAGRPAQALQLVQRLDGISGLNLAHQGNWIGRELRGQGDTALATSAFLMGLRANPIDWESVRALIELDPAAALALRDQLASTAEQDEGTKKTQDALLMLAAGRSADALSLIDELIAGDQLAGPAWDLLVTHAPGEAEKRLAARQLTDSDDIIANEMLLLRSIKSQGRNADGRQKALAMLAGDYGSANVALQIAKLYPDLARDWLEERTRTQPTADDWGGLGRLHETSSRSGEAIQAYLQAWSLEPNNSDYGRRLLNLDDGRQLPTIVARATKARDDELLGDIADKLWQQGQQAEALRYWQRALAFDESDSEWINKVAAVNAGRNPM